MSLHQHRADKSEAQLRKAGRFSSSGHQRGFAEGGGRGGGGGGSAPPPVSSSSSSASSSNLSHPPLLHNRSLKKSDNAHGGHSKVNQGVVGYDVVAHAASTGVHGLQDAGHTRAPSHVASVTRVTATKPVDSSSSNNTRGHSKPPHPQSSAGGSGSASQATSAKVDASKTFTLQFGSISPGFVNGMQIPVRTSSAPPNLDEQKWEQVRHDSFQPVPSGAAPPAPKPKNQVKKDLVTNQGTAADSHPAAQAKRDLPVQGSAAPSLAAQKSSVIPVAGFSVPMGFQQSQIPIQFGGPIPQMQSQGVTGSPLQIPVSLSMGNAHQVQQQMYVQSIPSHTFPQGMHQGMAFPPMASQMGNLRMGMLQQYAQPQDGNFINTRKTTVKITHPDTHEELRLDKRTDTYSDTGSSGQRLQHSNVAPQAPAVSSYTAGHQMNYYSALQPGSFNTGPFFLQTPTSIPLTSTQVNSGTQAPRYNYQIGQGASTVPFLNPPVISHMPVTITRPQSHGISEPMNIDRSHDGQAVSSASVQVTVKPPTGPAAEKVGVPPVTVSKPANSEEMPILLRHSGEASAVHQQRGVQKITSESFVQPSNSSSEPTGDTLLQSKGSQTSSIPSATTTQRMHANILPTLGLVLDSTPVVSVSDGRKKDLFKRPDSVKDQQKTLNTKDMQQLQQQQYLVHALDATKETKMQFLKMAVETCSFETNVSSPKDPANVLVDIGAGEHSPSTPPVLMVEHGASSDALVGTTVNDKAIPASDVSTTVILEKEEQGDVSSSVLAGLQKMDDSLPPRRDAFLVTSVSCDAETDGTVPKRFVASIDELSYANSVSKHEVLGGKDDVKVDASNDSLLSCSIEKECQDHSSLGSSSDADLVTIGLVGTMPVSGNLEESPSSKEEQVKTEGGTLQSFVISKEVEDVVNNLNKPAHADTSLLDVSKTEHVGLDEINVPSKGSHVCGASGTEFLNDKGVTKDSQEVPLTATDVVPVQIDALSLVDSKEVQKPEKVSKLYSDTSRSALSGTKEKATAESTRTKATSAKKIKRKDVLSRADAAGTSFDLYMAYKGPEEKQEVAVSVESLESSSDVDLKQVSVADAVKHLRPTEKKEQAKVEPDDWEDAIDVSSPNLRASDNGEPANGKKSLGDGDRNASVNRKYSRDFLFTLRDQGTDLPVGFEIGSDIADVLMNAQPSMPHMLDREPFPIPGRIIDRPTVAIRDRRQSNVDDDKWTKVTGPVGPGRDIHVDISSLRPGQSGGSGVLRNPRGQASSYPGGILSGPLQTMASSARSNADADRWQRGAGIQRGLIPSPQTPLQVMHKAEKRYEVGKVSDEEDAKQRQLKGILNKLTPQNFERLFQQVKEVNIDNTHTLKGVIAQIFDKALMEPTFCEMYANFCFHLASALPDFSEDNEKITFKRLLLNKCQEEFERGEREEDEANKDEGELEKSPEEREEKRIKARRRMLGNIRLIGELFKKRMLTERIMHECIKKLLGHYQNQTPDEENIEALCKLMSTIGEMIDQSKAKERMDGYFDSMGKLSINQKLSSRVRFMLRDSIDLRKNKWQQRRKVEGPKKIEEVHRDAAQERQAQTSRLSRGSSISSSGRRGPPPVDYGPRGSTILPSPSQSVGSVRGLPSQNRSFGSQDVRMEDRHSFEGRVSVPLPQRPNIDDSITLGPQGGLAKGMSTRGQPIMPSVPLVEAPSSAADFRRLTPSTNGYSGNSREEVMSRYAQDRHSGVLHDQLSTSFQDRKLHSGGRDTRNLDGALDRSSVTTPPGSRGLVSSIGSQDVSSEARSLSEECLRDKSISAIREFYSAKDEMEVISCVKELNCPGFYPSMVSLWIIDSFERKDNSDRDSLAKLLIHLSKPLERLLSQEQLLQGFESVLCTLEDTVNDAPRAGEFLGRIFAKVILEDMLPLREIGRLIQEGGEEPGRLVEVGLASEILGSVLEIIRAEKGNVVLSEVCSSSGLQLEDFRPPHPLKAKRLEAFL